MWIIKKLYAILLSLLELLLGIDLAKKFDTKFRFHKSLNLKNPQTLSDKVTYLSFPSAKCNKVLLISSGISYSDINISFENAATNFSSFSKSP